MDHLAAFLARFFPDSDASISLFPPASKYSNDMIPSLAGKVILVTGGNTGLGYETAKAALQHGPRRLYIAARSEDKARAAIKKLVSETSSTEDVVKYLRFDLSDLAAVRKSAETFLAQEDRLDVLFNNAGIALGPLDQLTTDGYDMQYGTNVIGPYLFTKLLFPALLNANEATGEPSRIVTTSSTAHKWTTAGASGIDDRTLKAGPERDATIKGKGVIFSAALYGQSKLANIFMSDIWAHDTPELRGRVVSCALHPGMIKTEVARSAPAWTKITNIFLYPPPMGAWTQLNAAFVLPAEEINGKYYIPWAREGKVSAQAQNIDTRHHVRQWLEKELL